MKGNKRSEDRRPYHNLSLLLGLAAVTLHPQANDLLDTLTSLVMRLDSSRSAAN